MSCFAQRMGMEVYAPPASFPGEPSKSWTARIFPAEAWYLPPSFHNADAETQNHQPEWPGLGHVSGTT